VAHKAHRRRNEAIAESIHRKGFFGGFSTGFCKNPTKRRGGKRLRRRSPLIPAERGYLVEVEEEPKKKTGSPRPLLLACRF